MSERIRRGRTRHAALVAELEASGELVERPEPAHVEPSPPPDPEEAAAIEAEAAAYLAMPDAPIPPRVRRYLAALQEDATAGALLPRAPATRADLERDLDRATMRWWVLGRLEAVEREERERLAELRRTRRGRQQLRAERDLEPKVAHGPRSRAVQRVADELAVSTKTLRRLIRDEK